MSVRSFAVIPSLPLPKKKKHRCKLSLYKFFLFPTLEGLSRRQSCSGCYVVKDTISFPQIKFSNSVREHFTRTANIMCTMQVTLYIYIYIYIFDFEDVHLVGDDELVTPLHMLAKYKFKDTYESATTTKIVQVRTGNKLS